MLKGFIDHVTDTGFIEGWAFNTHTPLDPLTISIWNDEDAELAWGVALHYREDLVAAECATGWCAFRVQTRIKPATLHRLALTLVVRDVQRKILRRGKVPLIEDGTLVPASVPDLVREDPTTIRSIGQLAGCSGVFDDFLKRHGVDAFVRASYVYVLGRAADDSGLRTYGQLIRRNALTPFQLLTTLTDSAEFHSRPRLLAAPTSAAFPYR